MNETEIVKLQSYLQGWTQGHPGWQQSPAQDIAAELARDADFGVIRVAGWLRSPEGTLIRQIVDSVLPYPYNYGADVLAEAIRIAAQQRTENQRLLTFIGGAAAAALLVMGLSRL
jgi:hypothetical protein